MKAQRQPSLFGSLVLDPKVIVDTVKVFSLDLKWVAFREGLQPTQPKPIGCGIAQPAALELFVVLEKSKADGTGHEHKQFVQ